MGLIFWVAYLDLLSNMKKKVFAIVTILISILFNFTSNVHAQVVNIDEVIDNIGFKNSIFSSSTNVGNILSRALFFVYAIAGFGLLIYLLKGGFDYLTSSGDPKKMEAGKNTITTALTGFLIVFGAFWITQIVSYIFGLGSSF